MTTRKTLVLCALLLCATLPLAAQQPRALTTDPAPNPTAPTQNLETVLDSHGSHITGMLMLAAGAQPHPAVILLHGFPGYEQNLDLAQTLRRAGFNVLAMHYRGSWGSQGTFTFTHCMEDVSTMLDYLTTPANLQKFHTDPHRLVVIGHSMGGFLAIAALAQHPASAQHGQIAAAVVITEGSPVHDTPDYFADIDPADYAPLTGTSPAALRQEAESHTTDWSFPTFAAQIAAASPKTPPGHAAQPASIHPPSTRNARPILILSANDGLCASNEALAAALKRAGSPVTYQHFPTDHGFSDHRIALQTTILDWLQRIVR
jgi:pimeloyl-ACP methyl ester carboxylesterase